MSEKKAEFAEIRQVYEVQRCLGNLKLNSVKNKTNIILVNCTRPVGQVVLEMHSSESKTYSSQTSGRVKVFCPVQYNINNIKFIIIILIKNENNLIVNFVLL